MIQASLAMLQDVLNADFYGDDVSFCGISIDSRTIEPGQLFVAIRGERFDGSGIGL